MAKKLNGTVIVTYRCNARCSMCNRYKAPSKPEEEISLETIRTAKFTDLAADSADYDTACYVSYHGILQGTEAGDRKSVV